MSKQLKVISINFPFLSTEVVEEDTLATDRALFDFDVVVIRPHRFSQAMQDYSTYSYFESLMSKKKTELDRLFAQGGVLVVLLDVPSILTVNTGSYSTGGTYRVNNYEFLKYNFVGCLRSGSGERISYADPSEPFVAVLKNSKVAWTAYVASVPEYPLNDLKFFASAGAGTAVAGRMAYGEGHLILLPNLKQLDEPSFFEACAEYRYKRQGSKPPDWVPQVFVPGLSAIDSEVESVEKQMSALQASAAQLRQSADELSAFRKLLYEKGKTQLEPIVRRALDVLGFETTPGGTIGGTIYEIDGRTRQGSLPGIVEVKGSKNRIVFDEFSPFVVKILADHQASSVVSKGILIGNGLCEKRPETRLGDVVFSQHVLDGSKRNSVALINSTELYWLCCTLLGGDTVDKNAVREAILNGNGHVDLKPFCGKSPWEGAATRDIPD